MKRRFLIISTLLLAIAFIPVFSYASADAAQIRAYTFSNVRDYVESSAFNVPNTNPIWINFRQWDNSGYNYTITYKVQSAKGYSATVHCSHSSSISNQNGSAQYQQMSGTPVAGSKYLRIEVTSGATYTNGYGELYQN
ncbi:MAG: hypothetical protein PHU69_14165 [Fermentimonas sp.]|nr:hypothetical protein [Fermentimonas sp.]